MKRRNLFKGLIVLAIVFSLALLPIKVSVNTSIASQSEGPRLVEGYLRYLTILTTSDLQSQVTEFETKIRIGGEKVKKTVGGIARIGYLVKKFKKSRKRVLFLTSGDDFLGPFYRAFKGIPETLFWDMIADAWTPGNHEFDQGPEVFGEALDYCTIPVLCANLDVTEEPALNGKIKPYTIFEVKGLKVGVFGLITPNLPVITNLGDKVKVNGDLVSVSKDMVSTLKSEGVDVIIALTHIGVDADKDLASKVDGIDVIVGGHSHTLLTEPVVVKTPSGGETIIVQDGARAAYLGELQIAVDKKGVYAYKWRLHLLDESVPKDPVLDKLVTYFINQMPPPAPVGESLVDLDARKITVRKKEAAIGNLFTDAFRWKFGTDAALTNGGGIRGDKIYPKGVITTKTLLEMHPFGNTIVLVKIKGSILKQALERGASALISPNDPRDPKTVVSGAFLQVSGLKFTIDVSKTPQQIDMDTGEIIVPGERVSDIYINGEPLDMDKEYNVAINSWNANGGDGYFMFKNLPKDKKYDTSITIPEVLEEYIRAHTPISPKVEGRITIIGSE